MRRLLFAASELAAARASVLRTASSVDQANLAETQARFHWELGRFTVGSLARRDGEGIAVVFWILADSGLWAGTDFASALDYVGELHTAARAAAEPLEESDVLYGARAIDWVNVVARALGIRPWPSIIDPRRADSAYAVLELLCRWLREEHLLWSVTGRAAGSLRDVMTPEEAELRSLLRSVPIRCSAIA